MGFFKGRKADTKEVIRMYLSRIPAIGHELQNLCEELRGTDVKLDFTECSLAPLGDMVRGAVKGERTALRDTKNTRSFMLRNRHIIGRIGTFLGCLVIEKLGGSWEHEEGGLIVTGIGGTNIQFDPFEAVIKAIISPENQSVEAQYAQLKDEIQGTGPRVCFREKVLAEIRKRGLKIKVGRISGLDVWLTNGTRIHLGNLYTTCASAPDSEDEAIESFIDAVISVASADGKMPGFKEAAKAIFPVLKTVEFMERPLANGAKLSEELVWQKYHCGLAVCFVYDSSGCFRFVRRTDLDGWLVTEEELRWHAIRNLGELTASLEHDIAQTSFGKAIVINANDGYDAARILLPGLRNALSPHLGESFFVAVPCRDLLVAFEDRKSLLARMKQWIRDDAHLGAYGLTDVLFVCDGQGTRPLGG